MVDFLIAPRPFAGSVGDRVRASASSTRRKRTHG
jgi:hypothetical protein